MNTIFALSTSPGKAGIAIVRISGKNALAAINYLGFYKTLKPRYATLGKLYYPSTGELIDEALLIYFPGPNSFTGEDLVELHVHGSRAVINSIMLLFANFSDMRMAEPGEFSLRSFLNGKMDLTKAEGLGDLINAETALQHKQALRQMDGILERLYEEWRSKIIEALSLVEAYIDFPDEDLPNSLVIELNTLLNTLVNGITIHLDDKQRGEKLRSGLYVAIIGAPNVGKSSLLNLLVKRDVAIVSNVAGTTRDIIEVHLDIAGYPITLADTAGLRDSNDLVENEGINRAKARAHAADFKIALFDVSQLPHLDSLTLEFVDNNTICVFNKVDLLNTDIENLPNIKGASSILLSTAENIGITELLKTLENYAAQMLSPSSDPVITHARYRSHLISCKNYLEQFSLDKPIELAAEDLRIAATELGKITGKINVEEILDHIFSKFCIGK